MEQEIWLPIKYGNGKKEISNWGNVRNSVTKQVLKSYTSKHNGYRHISFHISKEIKSKTFKIHRLVAEHFLPPIEGKHHVNHKDFDKLNNHVSNLEWCTLRENIDHYYREKFNHIVTDETVKFIRENIETMGATALAKKFNLKDTYVYGVANGIHKPNVYPELIREKRPSLPRKVDKYDMNGNFIETYISIGEAAKMNNAKLSYIQRVLTGEHKSYKGFIYKCEGYKQVKRKSRIDKLLLWKEKNNKLSVIKGRKTKQVEMFDTGGNKLNTFISSKDAALHIGTQPDTFRRSIRANKNGFHKGYIWKYA